MTARDVAALPPGEFVDLGYRVVLRRDPDPGSREQFAARIADGSLSRAEFLNALAGSDEFVRLRFLDDAIRRATQARGASERLGDLRAPSTMDERAIEIPWVLSRYDGERRVLDAGHAGAHAAYVAALLLLGADELVGVDLVPADAASPRAGARTVVADLRSLPFEDASFDLVFSVSTLEHVGQDNTLYGGEAESNEGAQAVALAELRRVLGPRGRLLVTVPCGRREEHGWFVQRPAREWLELFDRADLDVTEFEVYERGADGWRRAVLASGARYGADGASAVLCAELRAASLRRPLDQPPA